MDFRVVRTIFFYFVLASLCDNASAGGVIFEDLHLVPMYVKAHGIIMGLTFGLILPSGAILMRFLSSRGTKKAAWIHAGIQLVGWVLMISGLVMGIKTGQILDRLENNPHTIIGTIVVVLMLFQPVFGILHHRRILKTQKRGKLTLIHVWYGRVLILLGMINGGLGLKLAANTNPGKIAYGVVVGLVGATYIAVIGRFELKGESKPSSRAVDVTVEETMKPQSN